jgi:spore germination protein KB
MRKISTRQLLIFYFIYSFSVKFLTLPQILAGEAGRDAWIAAGLGVLVEPAVLFVVLCVMNREGSVKFLMPVMLVFFLLQALITLNRTDALLSTTLYESLSRHMLVIPMLVLGVFFVFTKTRAVFRAGEIFYILILIAIFLSVFPSLWKISPAETLPVLGGGVMPVLRAVFNNLVYFEAAFVLLMFKGEVEIKRGFRRDFFIWAAVGAVVFTVFVFFFCSLFGPLSGMRNMGIVDVTGVNSYIAQNGRLEWIIACVWLLLLLVRFGVLFYCCFAAVRHITPARLRPAVIAFPLAAAVYAMFLFVSLPGVLAAMRIPVAVFFVVVPILFWLLGGRKCLECSGAKKS